ncbi:conjugal transfer protein TraS [Paucibacter sp. KBW04]|uniref:relaxase/mobilization nuclease domain-containing protein n=1 Tax=Paucibacter sp. KBW04 TaxID=2153361 RepID=UPI000F573B80|nr:relaxase/mobilization nuclease domain-containing protein [Paucibacter sp. KBW04]RQO61750.1 conjugal transfer protein TraS [Paucibacter sp. KBW04]
MSSASKVDGVLVQWGDRLFYPGIRIVRTEPTPRLNSKVQLHAAVIRRRIELTVSKRAPQVMVKVTGGGRGMGAIAAHFRYISKDGRLEFEDDRGVIHQGKEALRELAEQWRLGGSLIDESSPRREAFNLMLSMPRGTDAQSVLQAAREFARIELSDHRYVMVLHEHQANPHVHLSVRAESMSGERLNPRKADLHRWRETFAERLRSRGIEAEATRQATRCEGRRPEDLWQRKAREEGRLSMTDQPQKSGNSYQRSRNGALEAWKQITQALLNSDQAADQELALRIAGFINESAFAKEHSQQPGREVEPGRAARAVEPVVSRHAGERGIER